MSAHIIPECAIGYKKFAKEMAGSPMILGVWSIRKKVSVKFWTSPFWIKSIFQIYLMKIQVNLKIGQLQNAFLVF